MEQTILTVQEGRYPFGLGYTRGQVQETQKFTSREAMREKKVEMLKKSEMVINKSIIKMTCIVQQEDSLLYYFQFVPDSIDSYLRAKHQGQTNDIWAMTKNLITKKLAYELTMLISYLGKMKIEVELSVKNLGISSDEKLKLYVSPRSKMGIKSQIQLFVTYNQAKEKIMKEVQAMMAMIDQGTFIQPEPQPKQPEKKEHTSRKQSFKAKFRSIPKIQTPNNHLRQTRTFQQSNQFRKRKMSSGCFDLGSGAEIPKFTDKPTEHKNHKNHDKNHKFSFQQCGTEPDQPFFSSNKNYNDQANEGMGMAQSKSVKIELEQTQNAGDKKQRKDSYKVKITTFREYQVEGNPGDLFGVDPNAQDDDIFQYFAKKAKREEQKPEREQQQEDEQNIYERSCSSDKNRKGTGQTNFTANVVPPSQPPSPLSPAYSLPEKRQIPKSPKLEERIKQAKQRASKALNMIKSMKK